MPTFLTRTTVIPKMPSTCFKTKDGPMLTTAAHYSPLLGSSNPFNDWDVNQRYANEANFNQALANNHRIGWEQAQMIVSQAKLDGLL